MVVIHEAAVIVVFLNGNLAASEESVNSLLSMHIPRGRSLPEKWW